jgi:hypothetical protein
VDLELDVEHGCLLKSLYPANAAPDFQVTRLAGTSFIVSTPTRARRQADASVDPTEASNDSGAGDAILRRGFAAVCVHELRAIGVEVNAEDQLGIRSHWLSPRLIRKKRRSRSGSADIIDSGKRGPSRIAMQRTRLRRSAESLSLGRKRGKCVER